MNEEDLDDWDEECMNILLEVEEKTLSSFSSPSQPQPLSQHSSLLLRPHHPPESRPTTVDHSPPRELSHRSQRHEREVQIQGLKSELGRVSKQLSDLEQECLKLRKERDKKNEQLNNLSSRAEVNDLVHSKRENSDTECVAINSDNLEVSRRSRSASICKATGVQTDDGGALALLTLQNNIPDRQDLSRKLLDIWDLSSNQTIGRNLMSSLLVACEADLHQLFGCMKSRLESRAHQSSNAFPQFPLHADHSLEASKVSHFYSMLTKTNNGMAHVVALLEPLLDLCNLENVFIVHRSLRILHELLKHMFCFDRKSGERDSVTVEGLCSGNKILNSHRSEVPEEKYMFSIGAKFRNAETFEKQQWNTSVLSSVSRVDWVSLFEVILQIGKSKTEEFVRVEAVCIMNTILRSTNAYIDREKFGIDTQVFGSISQILRKEAGLHLQKQSIQLLYLLLNCPKLLGTFCGGYTEEESTSMNIKTENNSAFKNFPEILLGLADCISCSGIGLQELELRRNAIVLLAFLASSGKPGFDILVSHKLPKDANFLILIMQVLVSEIDTEATSTTMSPEIFKERTLLIREVLILLNRLVSSPTYSATALQLLTKSRDIASLTIDVANRLSRKDNSNWHFEGLAWTTRKSEVVELAQVFKKRVFTYMGDHIP